MSSATFFFFFFFLKGREISLKSIKRNQVHKNDTRKSLKLNAKGARNAADQEYKE